MQELIIFLLGGAGLSIIVTMSKLFHPIRELIQPDQSTFDKVAMGNKLTGSEKFRLWLYDLITCPLCFGVYAGAAMYGIMMIPTAGYWIACSFAVSITSYIIAKFIG